MATLNLTSDERNLKKLIVEICECTNFISPSISLEYFAMKEVEHDQRIKNLLQLPCQNLKHC